MPSTSRTRRRLLQALALPVAAALVLGGCASTPSPEADREALLQRARAYWELVRQNDRVNAWKYEAVSKDQSMTLEGYLKRGGIIYESVEILGVRSLQGDEARVDMRQRYSVPVARLKNMVAEGTDHWRRIDGTWHHVLPKSSSFPGEQQ